MELVELQVEDRNTFGTSKIRNLRKQGMIPGVVYSEGKASLPLVISEHQYRHVVSGRGTTRLYKFNSSSKDLNGLMALVKAVQMEPIAEQVLHLDFLSVHEGHKITMSVPIELTGTSEDAKLGLGILNQTLYELEIECLPTDIPERFTIDITGLTLGHSLHASDIELPANVTLLSDPELSVVALLAKAEEEAAPVAAAAPEGAAPADGAAAAGATDEKAEKGKKE